MLTSFNCVTQKLSSPALASADSGLKAAAVAPIRMKPTGLYLVFGSGGYDAPTDGSFQNVQVRQGTTVIATLPGNTVASSGFGSCAAFTPLDVTSFLTAAALGADIEKGTSLNLNISATGSGEPMVVFDVLLVADPTTL